MPGVARQRPPADEGALLTYDDFIERLEGVRSSAGGVVALCPAHADSSQSLGVHEGAEGQILVRCHAGCTAQDIVVSMGLHLRDLFVQKNDAEPEAIYSYTDEMGVELFQSVRFRPKTFKQRHMGPDGEWVWNLQGVRRVLFRLPEILAAKMEAKTIWVTEGEKDALALVARGFEATCNPMGAGKWNRPEYVDWLADANVIIVADRDEPGRAHANTIKDSLLGRAQGVWVVQARSGKDATDHFDAGFQAQDFKPVKERKARGVFTAHDMAEAAIEHLEIIEADMPAHEPVKMHHLQAPIEYRPGRLYTLGGYTGDGKTAFQLQTARGLLEAGVPTGIFTNEMTESDLRHRFLEHLGIPLRVLERPWELRGGEWEPLYRQGVEQIRSWPLEIIFDPGITAEAMRERTIDGEYEFVILDHVHRFAWGNDRRRLEEQITEITNLSLEANIPILALAQLRRYTRGKDMENYPRPTLQDFRETEMLGMESARAMAIWRVREQNGTAYSSSMGTELIVLKDRHAALRSYFLRFNGARQLFELPDTTGGNDGSVLRHEGSAGDPGAPDPDAPIPGWEE